MKNILKKKNTLLFPLLIIFVIFIGYNFVNNNKTIIKEVKAETKDGECDGSLGNLYGYIDTENVGPIYLSNKSWEDATGGTTDSVFYVNYDKREHKWSGTGLNELVGLVDFSYDQTNHIVRFVSPGEEHDGGCGDGACDKWGGWNGEAILARVIYSQQNGSFKGTGYDKHGDTGGVDDEDEDDYVGSGTWTFDHVEFQDSACPENINLFIGGRNYWDGGDCPSTMTDVLLQWTSENVHSCQSLGAPTFWANEIQESKNTGTNVKANGTITESNTPITFTLSCIGDYSDMTIIDSVNASCGGNVVYSYCGDGNVDTGEACDDGNTTNGDGCSNVCEVETGPGPGPGTIISPKLIEA